MDPTVVAACDLAVNFVFGPTATYRPIGAAADTAFSGSAVIELEVQVVIPKTTTTNGGKKAHNTNTTRVVLKHSSVRTLSKHFVTTTTSEKEDDIKCKSSSKKYAAALKVDRSSRNEYAFLQSYSEKLLQFPPSNINDDDGISISIRNKYKNKNDEEEEIKLIKTKTRIPRTLFARNHPTEGITLLLESLSSFGDSCGNDNDNDDHISNHHSCDTNTDNNNDETTTSTTTTTSSSTSTSGRVTAIPLGPKLNATLEWLANFHAHFLPRSLNPNTFLNDDNDNSDSDLAAAKEVKEKEELEKKVSSLLWSIGTHLSLEKRSPIELQQLPRYLKEFVERFQNNKNDHDNENDHDCCCNYFQTPQATQQGQRIQDVAVDVAHYLHPDNNPAHKTIVHGDYKQGNMFFATTTNNNNNNTTAVTTVTATTSSRNNNGKDIIDIVAHATHQHQKIAVFDWQWTGPGLGATDLVYLCVMAVSDEALVDYETNIIRPYHNYLIQALTTSTRNDNKNHSNIDGTTTTTTTTTTTNNNNEDEDEDEDEDDDDDEDNNNSPLLSLYPYNELLNEFKIAMIDLQRWMGGSRYKSMTLETVQKAANQSIIDVNHGIFRRSMTRIVWIFKIVDLALDDIESGRIQLLK